MRICIMHYHNYKIHVKLSTFNAPGSFVTQQANKHTLLAHKKSMNKVRFKNGNQNNSGWTVKDER